MVKTCTVCSLTNSRQSAAMFQLPKDEATAARLLYQLGFDSSYEPGTNMRVCEKHFTPDSLKSWGGRKTLNDDPVVVGFEKTDLTRDMLRAGDGKLYKLVEAPDQEPGEGKRVMILKEATPPPKPLPVNTKGSQTFKAEIIKLEEKLHKEKRNANTLRNELNKLFTKEQKKNGKFSDEFNENLQAILNASTTRQSARLQSKSDDESESEDKYEEPSSKRSHNASSSRSRTGKSLNAVSSVKQELKFELVEEHLYEDENELTDQLEEFTTEEPMFIEF